MVRVHSSQLEVWNQKSTPIVFINLFLLLNAPLPLRIIRQQDPSHVSHTHYPPLLLHNTFCSTDDISFSLHGFSGTNLHLDGIAGVTPDGLLRLTDTTKQNKGHAFYPTPILFKNSSSGNALSFSTSFVFAIRPRYKDLSGHGIAFVLSRSGDLSQALPSQYLGLFKATNNGDETDQIIAIKLDTNYNPEFGDIDNNHVGIDVNSLNSVESSHASYFSAEDGGGFKNLSLVSGEPMQVWVEYDQEKMLLNVTLAPTAVPKPNVPLLSSFLNLSSLISDRMYIGFSSSTGSFPTSHYILGWTFALNGKARALDLSRLPPLPRVGPKPKSKLLIILSPIIGSAFILTTLAGAAIVARRKMKYAEVLEDWEMEYGPQRFSYKDLYIATKGFKDKELLGAGGFGRVYRGVLPKNNLQVAVKKVSHESRQGVREFIAEIISIGRVRHRNLVQLLGYCRRKGELLLVYECMPNGSLDKLLFDKTHSMIDWDRRFRIIKGVASGLFYLHEEWDQVVVHRDIKASNILLDAELNGRLGDFGLARLYDHGTDPQTTRIVGTLGYLAPELPRYGKATTGTDVYSFGGFLLEVACGRRPIETRALPEEMILVDWVLECWKRGTISEVKDPNLGDDFKAEELELVLKLGLLCSHLKPELRPGMRLVIQVLEGNAGLPEMSEESWLDEGSDGGGDEPLGDYVMQVGVLENIALYHQEQL